MKNALGDSGSAALTGRGGVRVVLGGIDQHFDDRGHAIQLRSIAIV